MEFPIYRKYNGIDVWFKINSNTEFTEYRRLGSKLLEDHVKATIFPEKQFIQDMILFYEERWVEVSANELNEFINA
jgi:hypothetical protein